MSLENSNSTAEIAMSNIRNIKDDSDYDSMFGDDSDIDADVDENNNDTNENNNNNIDMKKEQELLQGVEQQKEQDETRNNNDESSSTTSHQIIAKIPRKKQHHNGLSSLPSLSYSSPSTIRSRKKKRKLSSASSSLVIATSSSSSSSPSTNNNNNTTQEHENSITPSFDINSYNDYSSDAIVDDPTSYDEEEDMFGPSTSIHTIAQKKKNTLQRRPSPSPSPPPLKILKPNEYPKYTMNDFWSTFRKWDFLKDLNLQSSKNHPPSKQLPLPHESDYGLLGGNHPLPNVFHCHEQYIALWSPLLLREAKAQLISDVSSLHSPPTSPLSKYVQAVQVTVKNVGSSSNNNNTEDDHFVTLSITSSNQDQRSGVVGGGISSSLHQSNLNNRGTLPSNQGRNAKVAQHLLSRNEYTTNEMIYLITEPSFLDQACKGSLKNIYEDKSGTAKASTYCMMSLIANASPFAKGKLGVVGIVTQRCKNLKHGLLVQISKRLLKDNAPNQFNVFLLRLGHCVTAIREFKALCNVHETPLMKYFLSAQKQNKITTLATYEEVNRRNPLSEHSGRNALGIGFRIWVKSKFNHSQQEAINGASREYGSGGFTLVKGPPGTGKTTTLAALVNALHLRQYQKYYSEIEKITLLGKTKSSRSQQADTLAAIAAAAKVKPRILIAAPSNAAIDNIIQKIIDDSFMDGNGTKYRPSLVRVGTGFSSTVSNLTLDHKVNQIIGEGSRPKVLEEAIQVLRKDLKTLQIEIENLQRRVRLIANASIYTLSRDWEIRIDEQNFKTKERVLFVNHKLKKVDLKCPPKPKEGEDLYPVSEMPHYRSCMASLIKYIERHNESYSKLMQLTLVQNAAGSMQASNYNQIGSDLYRELETHVLNSTHIVMTTLGSAGSKTMEDVMKFSVIVIDEAACSSEPSTLPALQLGSSHCVLVGDPQQLPATTFAMSGRELKYDRSLFQRLEEGGHDVTMLNIQYRMHSKISAFPRKIFYEGSLLDGPNVTHPDYGGPLAKAIGSTFRYFQPLTVLDLDSSEEREGAKLSNLDEAKLVLYLYSSIDKETNGLVKKSKVAIITPYMQQVFVIKRLFEDKFGLSYNRLVDISTVDAFQGKESEIVILSCVRAASKSVGIGFLSDVQRMNVALTRAKHFLFVITRCRTILVNPYWRDFVGFARSQQAILRIVPRKSNQSNIQNRNGKRNIVKSIPLGQFFPDLRFIKPIHHGESSYEIIGSHSMQELQGAEDGNISA